MTVTFNRPDKTLIDETKKEAALINVKIPLTHDPQATITEKQSSIRTWPLNQATVAAEKNCCYSTGLVCYGRLS
jgi:hypothetical protein